MKPIAPPGKKMEMMVVKFDNTGYIKNLHFVENRL